MYYVSPLMVTEEQLNDYIKKRSSTTLRKFLGKGEIEIIKNKLIYYPFWISLIEAFFKRPFMKDRVVKQCMAVDGYKGKASMVAGKINTISVNHSLENSLEPAMDLKEVKEIITSACEEKLMYKYKKVPEINIDKIELIYKPKWVVRYQTEEGIKHIIIDGDTGQVSYDEELFKALD